MAAFPPIPTLLDSPVPLPGARARASRLASLGCALLLVLAVAPEARADTNTAPVPVSEGWRYRWGDSPAGAGGIPLWAQDPSATAEWKEVEALKEPPGKNGNKFLWLSVPLPDGPWAEPALLVGEVTNAIEVYSNGKRVYTSGVLNPDGWEISHNMTWHLIPVPPEALGSRLLLRLQSSNPNIGIFQYARIGSRAELLASVARDGQTPFVLAILLLSVAVGAGGAFLLHWRRRMLAGLAVFTASGGLIMQGLSGMPEALWNASLIGTRGTLLGVFLLVAGLIEFVSDAILNNERRWFRLGAMGFSAMSGLCAFISIVDLGTGQRLMVPFLPLTLSLMVVCLVIASIEAWRGNPDARLFIIGLSGLIFFTFMTVLPVIGVISTNFGNVTHWGYLALTLSLLGIVARRSIQVVRSLEAYTHKLEERQQEVRNLAERMGTGAGELATVVQQLRSTSDQQTEGVSRQAAALQEAEQTVKEIRRSSQMTAEKASSLAASAESAEQVGREGTAALERTLSDLAAIRTEVSEMARKILALDERTREVSGIVDSVKDLADQSNMLAINAAIEAARSGESGRGFGVVAREMRGLADQSIRATHRIREVLNGVSASMREAAQSSEKGDERVRLSLDAVRTSSAQFQQLAIIIGDSSASMRQITAAVSAQDAGTQQMAMAIQELSGQMQRTLKTVQETQEATRSVQALAESMSGIANQSLRTDEPLAPRS
ncbi:methyl-accepting chemotaxis protein [Myxococcus stipitatus]|uniref:methyl-accepting chemotaxis protein n=1 Tax=Myxococcus stipitatus TaxID=83455 RepID=UPI001F1C966D|nr:methyl-accepting chemotaxis protein [Myxococcus stipitatus]MCE9672564.1 methyl-accepting chemotaxis protein [Myxococcus stipitatus]